MLIFRFLRDVPDLGARAGDELCVQPKNAQFPAVLRRTFTLDDIMQVIADTEVTEHIYSSTPDAEPGDADQAPAGSPRPIHPPRHLRLLPAHEEHQEAS